MIVYLTDLKSTNDPASGGGENRHVHITVGIDSHPTNTTLGFLINGKIYKLDVNLAPNTQHKISLKHAETGKCMVCVIDNETRISTGKFLNLDAQES